MENSEALDNCTGLPAGTWMKQLLDDATEKAVPISVTFELTPKCGFNCKMCYVHLSDQKLQEFGNQKLQTLGDQKLQKLGGVMPASEWIRLGREASEAGALWMCITGGDPLLHPQFREIYTALSEMGFLITVQTNGSLITPDIIDLFTEYPPHAVKITVYGSNDEVYEQVCGVKNGFTRVNQGIRCLLAAEIPVELVTTVIKRNLKDLINIGEYAASLDVRWYYSSAAYPSVRGAETDARSEAIDEYDATDFRAEIRNAIENPRFRKKRKPCENCKGYRKSFWVLWNGQMNFCSFFDGFGIDVKDKPLTDCWQKLIEVENDLDWPEECKNCEAADICNDCIGMIAAYSGSTKCTDKARCEKFRKYYREIERII